MQFFIILISVFICNANILNAKSWDGYNRRLTPEEREKIFTQMEEEFRFKEVACQVDPNPPTNPFPLPKVPESFISDVEFSIFHDSLLSNKRVIYGKEMFHGGLEAGVVQYELGEGLVNSRPYDFEETIHYSVMEDEALDVVTNTGCTDEGSEDCHPFKICNTHKIEDMNKKLQEIFGFVNIGDGHGFMGASGILEFGEVFRYKYDSDGDCRGMRCQIFTTCLADPSEEETVKITYYWSHPSWSVESKGEQVPVTIDIYATGKYAGLFTKKIRHRYDFYNFLYNAEPDLEALAPPPNVYCHGRNVSYEPPTMPRTFSYQSEIVTSFDINNGDQNKIKFTTVFPQTESYDWNKKISETRFVPFYISGEERRHDHKVILIQDFNQGLMYDIKPNLETCNISMIENITSIGDVVVNNGSVSMLNPWAFMDVDEPMQYTGPHYLRGQSVDSWAGVKRTFIPFVNETVVIYYASTLVPPAKTRKSKDQIPVRMERHIAISDQPHTIINMYDFESSLPLTHLFDISMCFPSKSMRHFIIQLPGDTIKILDGERELLKYAAQESLALEANVSPLRINRLVIEEGENLNILFTILDLPTEFGDSGKNESNLSVAVQKIQNSVDAGSLTFFIPVQIDGSTIPPQIIIKPVPNTMVEVNRLENNYYYEVPKQYNSGDMAGIGIGMILTGILLGVVINMAIRKKSGVDGFSFAMMRLSKRNIGESDA